MIQGNKLGEGTFGIVYSAECKDTGKKYALKRNLAENDITFMSSLRELNLLYLLSNHPNIIGLEMVIFGKFSENTCFSPLSKRDHKDQRDDGVHFIFDRAEYDLYHFIYKSRRNVYKYAKKIMEDLIMGLEYMHANNIIHRDLKPGNILIFFEKNKLTAKLCDFGSSKVYTTQGVNTPGMVTYM